MAEPGAGMEAAQETVRAAEPEVAELEALLEELAAELEAEPGAGMEAAQELRQRITELGAAEPAAATNLTRAAPQLLAG